MAKLPGGLPVWRGHLLLRRARDSGGSRPAKSAVPVTAERHPALYSLVEAAVGFAGTAPPDRVALGGTALVTAARGTLTIGLPLVWGLSADQLRAVLTHEL